MRVLFIHITFFSLFFFSCSDAPKGLLPQKKMQQVLWDVLKADTYTKQFLSKDSTKNLKLENAKMQMQIFALHKVTKEDFYLSYEYYKTKPQLFNAIMDSISNNTTLERYTEYDKYKTNPSSDSAGFK